MISVKYVPDTIISATKQGFLSPDASWFKGQSIDYVRQTLLDGQPHLYKVLDRKAIGRLVNQHLDGKKNRRLLIWTLLNIESWLNLYIHGDK